MTLNIASLRIEAWSNAGSAERDGLARDLINHLPAAASALEYVGLQSAGREASRAPIPVWRDKWRRAHWILVPAGEFRPGYSVSKLERLRELVSLTCGDAEPGAGAPTEKWFDQLAATGSVQVEPFLMSSLPLLQSAPGLSGLVSSPRSRRYGLYNGAHVPLALHDDELLRVLSDNGWDLPSVHEFDWALRGGREVLFPWGDELPTWMQSTEKATDELVAVAGSDDPSALGEVFERLFEECFPSEYSTDLPDWNRANPFGVVDGNVSGCWARQGAKLFRCGGAGDSFPWQSPMEWSDFLTAASRPVRKDRPNPFKPGTFIDESHAVRPVIRIAVPR